MAYFPPRLINGLTLGSIYGLIAIGYTMVYRIVMTTMFFTSLSGWGAAQADQPTQGTDAVLRVSADASRR